MSEEQSLIGEKEMVENAVYQARCAAQLARECAALFDSYADLLSSGGVGGKADEARRHALGRLRVLKESVERGDEWLAQARGVKEDDVEAGQTEYRFWS